MMSQEEPFAQAQRVVLQATVWEHARHLVLSFPPGAKVRRFLQLLKQHSRWPAAAHAPRPEVQISLGFSRRGLDRAGVPNHVLGALALKAPAFTAGAARRAASHLGATGQSAAATWEPAFAFDAVDAVVTLHANDPTPLEAAVQDLLYLVERCALTWKELTSAQRLGPERPKGAAADEAEPVQLVHFGYRDGLSKIGIRGFTDPKVLKDLKPSSVFEVGEFLLGYPQNSGANPWLTGPQKKVLPAELRAFFVDGSFGVLHQVEQHVGAFEKYVLEQAKSLGKTMATPDPVETLRAKLCGRGTDGMPLAQDIRQADPTADFDYTHDPHGHACPFGAHVRRMNPRLPRDRSGRGLKATHPGSHMAHADRVRPLIRRGMPYGPPWQSNQPDDGSRGLMGLFFCTSIEDQYEHLISEWAERVPLGSPDRGRARDPLMGAHASGDGAFEIPLSQGDSLMLKDFMAFTRTRGVAYLFFPSLAALQGMADSHIWAATDDDDEGRP